MMKRPVWLFLLFLSILALLLSLNVVRFGWADDQTKRLDYKQEMVILLEKLHSYAKKKKTDFQLLGNNGLELFKPDETYGEGQVKRMLAVVDGIFMEEFYYGWEMKDDQRTPYQERIALQEALQMPIKAGLPILNLDYCSTVKNIKQAYGFNDKSHFIGFVADHRNLDRLPHYPVKIHQENAKNIRTLKEIKNYFILLNPERFVDKKTYIQTLRQTNYDLLILDLTFNGDPLTKEEIASLKVKQNGGSRLVFSYMSVGEAENYRYYWQQDWNKHLPTWIGKENIDWSGNYKVQYWTKEWQDILFGTPEAYLDQILINGFDGVFMDVIDAFVYFREK